MARRKLTRHMFNRVGDGDLMHLLRGGDPDELESPFTEFIIGDLGPDLWAEYGDAIVAEWISHSPGSRPWAWWKYTAPEPRRRLGGTGMAVSEKYPGVAPLWAYGLPIGWECGAPIFETQAAYLKRLGLLLPGERSPIHEPHPVPDAPLHYKMRRSWP